MRKVIKNIFKENGFSILEIIVVMLIIVIGMVGIASLNVQSIQAYNYNKNVLIASHLAQEGVELVRNKRDQNWTDGNDWKSGEGAYSNTDIIQDDDYTIDYTGNIEDSVDSTDDEGARLKIDFTNGFYNHSFGENTIFYRIIEIEDNTDDDYFSLKCTVAWQERGRNHSYEVNAVFYDWR